MEPSLEIGSHTEDAITLKQNHSGLGGPNPIRRLTILEGKGHTHIHGDSQAKTKADPGRTRLSGWTSAHCLHFPYICTCLHGGTWLDGRTTRTQTGPPTRPCASLVSREELSVSPRGRGHLNAPPSVWPVVNADPRWPRRA